MPKANASAREDAPSALDEFKNHPVANLLGIRVVSVTKKRVKAEMHVTPSHINRAGRVGGGLIMTFADICGARGTVAHGQVAAPVTAGHHDEAVCAWGYCFDAESPKGVGDCCRTRIRPSRA